MRSSSELKPQDILVMLKMLSGSQSQKDLAEAIGLSQAEVSHAIKRLMVSRLLDSKRAVNRRAAIEFLVHGLKYAFPAEIGPVSLGIPSAYSHPSFKFVQHADSEKIVWADAHGSVRGHSISPLYPSAAQAALRDPALYELLSLVDMIRIGRAREVDMAAKRLEEKLEVV